MGWQIRENILVQLIQNFLPQVYIVAFAYFLMAYYLIFFFKEHAYVQCRHFLRQSNINCIQIMVCLYVWQILSFDATKKTLLLLILTYLVSSQGKYVMCFTVVCTHVQEFYMHLHNKRYVIECWTMNCLDCTKQIENPYLVLYSSFSSVQPSPVITQSCGQI